ncbi:MAG: hypothetical protein FWG31_09840, partial [Oscillospiraceae bacterium]|nr:hypothetical protein [Oscillospiraceae bacterium]
MRKPDFSLYKAYTQKEDIRFTKFYKLETHLPAHSIFDSNVGLRYNNDAIISYHGCIAQSEGADRLGFLLAVLFVWVFARLYAAVRRHAGHTA